MGPIAVPYECTKVSHRIDIKSPLKRTIKKNHRYVVVSNVRLELGIHFLEIDSLRTPTTRVVLGPQEASGDPENARALEFFLVLSVIWQISLTHLPAERDAGYQKESQHRRIHSKNSARIHINVCFKR